MRLLKFYGETMEQATHRIKQRFGADVLILNTRTITPGSSSERRHPGARYEVTVALERDERPRPKAFGQRIQEQGIGAKGNRAGARPGPRRSAVRRPDGRLLEDLAKLRAQIKAVLEEPGAVTADIRDQQVPCVVVGGSSVGVLGPSPIPICDVSPRPTRGVVRRPWVTSSNLPSTPSLLLCPKMAPF